MATKPTASSAPTSNASKAPASKAPKGGAQNANPELNSDPSDKTREYELGVVMGPPGFGKTSFVDMLAQAYARKGGRVWVVDPNDAWKGLSYVRPMWPAGGMRGAEGKATIDDLIAAFENNGPGLLILDDADKYARHATEVIDDLMTSFRHWQKDVVVVTRRPQGIPKDAVANASWFALFSCREVYARRYVSELFGTKAPVLKEIPDEPHKFLYVRHDAYLTRALYQTAPRNVVTKSHR